jgi:hypothetical protein
MNIILNFFACVIVAYSLRMLINGERSDGLLSLKNFSSPLEPVKSVFNYILEPRLERNVFSFPESFMTTASLSFKTIRIIFKNLVLY